jgi:hypothetical protein
MAFILKLIRRPKSARNMQKAIQTEVKKSLTTLSGTIQVAMEKDVEDWDEKPEFKTDVTVNNARWQISGKTDKRTKMGKIYTYVDKGTAQRGGHGSPYPIMPKNKKGMLRFSMPHVPKSMPNPVVSGFPSTEPKHDVVTKAVMHPGIYPRNFTKTIVDKYLGRKSGSFKAIIDAAIKRAVRAQK